MEQNCSIHPKYKLIYLQVKGFENNKPNQKLFYCVECVESDDSFNLQNYQLIQKIIECEIKSILPKWPPVSDNKLISNIIEHLSNDKTNPDFIMQEIIQFFDQLKKDILIQVDILQKKTIESINSHQFNINKDNIINQYENISQINQLKSILTSDKTEINEKEKQYKELVDQLTESQTLITNQLQEILNQSQQELKIDFKQGLEMKEVILSTIHKINILSQNIPSQPSNHNNLCQQLIILNNKFQHTLDCKIISKNNNNNNKLEVIYQNNNEYLRVVSDLIIKPDVKFIFRVKFQQLIGNFCCFIGLRTDQEQHQCQIYCQLEKQNEQLTIDENDKKRCKQLKGDGFSIQNGGIVELRVCRNESIVHLLDYPLYKNKLSLVNSTNEYQLKQDQRLYFGNIGLNSSMELIDTFIVNEFID